MSTFRTFPATSRSTSSTRESPLDNTTYVLILLVILIPIIFTIILCSITYCVYRYNKKRSQNARRYAPTITDRSGTSIATVVYNPQHNPYMLEELPPSYDSLEEIKKHFHQTTTNNQSVANPTASTPPPPSYRELLDNVNNK